MKWNVCTFIVSLTILTGSLSCQKEMLARPEIPLEQQQEMAPGLGYLRAHRDVQNPYTILGGPITVVLSQDTGGVHVVLPDFRRIDPRVFGTPDLPKGFGGTPEIYGVPLQMRGIENGAYTRTTERSLFGDSTIVMPNASMVLEAWDITATDAAITRDSVFFEARWEDSAGSVYKVRCTSVLPYGIEFPVFGGVVTNHILHGVSSIGSALMPTGFAFVAFWGTGDLLRNDTVTDSGVLIQGMYSELTRGDSYRVVFDHEVTPVRRQFHLIVPPFEASEDMQSFVHRDVHTGFMLTREEPLSFWHVIFDNVQIESARDYERDGAGEFLPCPPVEEMIRKGREISRQFGLTEFTEGENGAHRDTSVVIVEMKDERRYVPERVRIQRGEMVRWINSSNLVHTVTADSSLAADPQHVRLPSQAIPFNSGIIPPGGIYERVFSVSGRYRYFCIPHEMAGMVGELVVE